MAQEAAEYNKQAQENDKAKEFMKNKVIKAQENDKVVDAKITINKAQEAAVNDKQQPAQSVGCILRSVRCVEYPLAESQLASVRCRNTRR